MLRRSVATVPFPTVPIVAFRERGHEPVARDLGNDRSTGDRVALGVSLHHRSVCNRQRTEWLAIDQDMIRRDAESLSNAIERASHREDRGMIDVDAIDFARGGSTESHGLRLRENQHRESFARGRVELLGIVHASNGSAIVRHDDRACDNGAREGAPSNFINSGEQRPELCPGRPLDRAPAPHEQSRGERWAVRVYALGARTTLRSLMRAALPVTSRR